MGEEIARQILFQPPSKTMSGSLNGQERKKAHISSQAQNQNSDSASKDSDSASKDSASASVHSRLSDMSHTSNENAIDPEQTAFAASAVSAPLYANQPAHLNHIAPKTLGARPETTIDPEETILVVSPEKQKDFNVPTSVSLEDQSKEKSDSHEEMTTQQIDQGNDSNFLTGC
jgi:hypothetical protein